MKVFIFIIFLQLIFVSCKKDKVPPLLNNKIENDTIVEIIGGEDTIHSSDYICAYPGSWWIYSDNTVSSCQSWKKVKILSYKKIENTVYQKKYNFIVPKFEGNLIFNESESVVSESLDSSNISPRISFSLGEFYFHQEYYTGGSKSLKRIGYGILDSLVVGNQTFYEVLKIEDLHQWFYSPGPNGPYGKVTKYYAKNIGLVKEVDQYIQSIVETKELINYYIAPH